MDSGNQGPSSQPRGQQSHASNPSRNTTNLFPTFMSNNMQGSAGNIWSNARSDSLPRDSTASTRSYYRGSDANNTGLTEAVASTSRPTALDGGEIWPRPGTVTWNSTDSQTFRSSASRSTSPPNPGQNASSAAPSFSNPMTNKSTTAFMGSHYAPTYATPANTQSHYASYADNTQAGYRPQGSVQDVLSSYQRSAAGNQALYEDAGSRDSVQTPLRQSESETPSFHGNGAPVFPVGFGAHPRQASRMSLSGVSSFAPQQAASRSQSQSFIAGGDHTQAAMEAVQNQLLRSGINAISPQVSRLNGTTMSASASAWPEFTPLGNGILQDRRRDSQVNGMPHLTSNNSPRNYATRQADLWDATSGFQDPDPIHRYRGQVGVIRPGTQSPYTTDLTYNAYTVALQAQMLQLQNGGLQAPYANYNFQPPQFFPPTGPAGMVSRGGRAQDPNVGIRCAELEEFRRSSKSNRKWELKNVFGRVVEFAGDQQGSRFLQEKIPTANSDDRQTVFDEIMVNANALMVDVFGNYVIQQLFQHGTMVQKKLLAAKMKDNVVSLSKQLYGCRCVQEAIQYVLVEQQVELAKELEPKILEVMKNDNGNHVVQKILSKLPRDRIDFVYDAVRGRVFELSQQQYACRVIQRMIEKGNDQDRAFLLQEFQEVASRLVTDNWGNYVVQAVIRQGGLEARSQVIRLCINQFLTFSKQKVASNVMEHCIEYGTREDRLEMYRLMTQPGDDGSSMLHVMWKDNFANYVVQKLCHCLTGAEQAQLVSESRPYFESRKTPSRPDDKWLAFEKLINQLSVPSRQGSICSISGGVIGASLSRPHSQSGSAMPTPDLTTGGNSPRTSSSQDPGDATLEPGPGYLVAQFSKASLHSVDDQMA